MLRLFIILTLLNVSTFDKPESGEKKKKDKESNELMSIQEQWFEDSILTTDEVELKGLVWFNDNNGALSFRGGTDARVSTARSISGFEFFDENYQKQRVFYSIEYEDPISLEGNVDTSSKS